MVEIDPPRPGRRPVNRPISVARMSEGQCRIVVVMPPRWSIATAFVPRGIIGTFAASLSERSFRSCEKAKRPMSTGRKSKPARSESNPKVNRATPLTTSSPTDANNSPSTPAISPLTSRSPARLAAMVSAKTTREK